MIAVRFGESGYALTNALDKNLFKKNDVRFQKMHV